jgi:hypothetical protein
VASTACQEGMWCSCTPAPAAVKCYSVLLMMSFMGPSQWSPPCSKFCLAQTVPVMRHQSQLEAVSKSSPPPQTPCHYTANHDTPFFTALWKNKRNGPEHAGPGLALLTCIPATQSWPVTHIHKASSCETAIKVPRDGPPACQSQHVCPHADPTTRPESIPR